jgi:hypothetical protein
MTAFIFRNHQEAVDIIDHHFNHSDRVMVRLNTWAAYYISSDTDDALFKLAAWEGLGQIDLNEGGIIHRRKSRESLRLVR